MEMNCGWSIVGVNKHSWKIWDITLSPNFTIVKEGGLVNAMIIVKEVGPVNAIIIEPAVFSIEGMIAHFQIPLTSREDMIAHFQLPWSRMEMIAQW